MVSVLPVDDHRRAGEGRQRVTSREEWREGVHSIASAATRTLVVLSHDLEHSVFDDAEFTDAVRNLLLSRSRASVRILVRDLTDIVSKGHRLVQLGRRLSSFIEFRQVQDEYRDRGEVFVVADRSGVAWRPHHERYEGFYGRREVLTAADCLGFFDEIWNRSQPSQELRRLHLG